MLKFLLGLVITVVGIPMLTLVLLLDFTPDIPVDYYETTDPQSILEEEINRAIAGIEDGRLALSISEENINKIIYNVITDPEGGVNMSYAPGEACTDAACEFIQYESTNINGEDVLFGVTGMWVEFYEDVISLNISVKGNYLMDFQTRMRLEFEVEDTEDEYKITYSKIRVGNIPLPKGIIKPIVNLVVEQANLDVSQFNNEFLTVEVEELRAVVDKTALVQNLSDDPGTQAGLNIIFANQLVTLDVFEEPARFEIYVDMDKLSVDTEPMSSMTTTFDLEGEITRQMNNILLSVFTGNPQIVINEETINALVATTMGDLTASQLIPMGETELDVGIEGIWLEFDMDQMEINFQLKVNQNNLLLEINTIASNENGNLVFTVNEAYLGRDPGEPVTDYITISAEEIAALAGGMNISNELFSMNLGEGRVVILKDSISQMLSASSTGITVDAIMIGNESLIIDITLPQQEIIQEVVAEVTEVFDNLEGGVEFLDDSVPEEAAFEDKLQEIAQTIDVEAGQVDINPEDMEELTELYNELDPEAQGDFIEYIEGSVDPAVLAEFINSFGG